MDRTYFESLLEKVKVKMDENRYNHTLGVAHTAAALAMCYGSDSDKALIAGILHDNAKCGSDEEILKECNDFGIEVTDFERNNPFMLHGKLGAYYARTEFGIEDEDIINSIVWHTTGRPEMSLLEKIIFVADYIEPLRYKQKNLKEIRELAFSNLDECVYVIARDTVDFIESHGKNLDDMTVLTRDFYKK